MSIQPTSGVSPIAPIEGAAGAERTSEVASPSFANVFTDVVASANQDLVKADEAMSDFATGKSDDLNSVVMASVKADLSFRFLLEMRNKVTESYQELSRMQF